MKVLLATDSAVLRQSVSTALADRGHDVRVLIRPDVDAPTHWPARVEPWPVHAAAPDAMIDAAKGCTAAIVIDGLVARVGKPADNSIDLTALAEAAAASPGMRWMSVSPRLADAAHGAPGTSDGVRVHCDPIYGTGDDAVSLFLIMMRTLPAVPVLGATHPLRPLWHEDLARGLAALVSTDPAAVGQSVEFVAPESVTYDELYERLARLIDRRPARLPVPDFVAQHGGRLAGALGLSVPFDPAMLAGTDAPASASTALTGLGVAPTSLDIGLRRLANELPEVVPSQGVGRIQVKRFFADITGSPHSAPELLRLVRSRFGEVMPIPVGVEPVSPLTRLDPGGVITMNLPARGHVQIRVAEATDEHVVGVTLHGHALAGCVRFCAHPAGHGIRFEVMACETASNSLDWVSLSLGGAFLQDANWKTVVQNVVKMSGGQAVEVTSDTRRLSEAEAQRADRWIRELVEGRPDAVMPAELLPTAHQ